MHMFSPREALLRRPRHRRRQVPLGTGLAFAHKYREDGGVCVTYLGDGAVNQGQVYESFNMAALWKLPVVYVIENNQYAMGTSVKRASASPELLQARRSAYGIPGEAVDGMDVLAVRAAAERRGRPRPHGKGRYILEMKTYRYRGHSMSDPAKYRTREEVEEVRAERDPIDQLRKNMLASGLADEATLKAIDKEIRDDRRRGGEFAQDSPEPDAVRALHRRLSRLSLAGTRGCRPRS